MLEPPRTSGQQAMTVCCNTCWNTCWNRWSTNGNGYGNGYGNFSYTPFPTALALATEDPLHRLEGDQKVTNARGEAGHP